MITAARFSELFKGLQKDLLTLSTHSRWINAGASDHYVQLQQPDLVVAAIREMIEGLE